jgi:hypothetical protein
MATLKTAYTVAALGVEIFPAAEWAVHPFMLAMVAIPLKRVRRLME